MPEGRRCEYYSKLICLLIIDVLKLAAAVESNAIHPIGKAIREVARVAKCPNVKADDGTYMEEPGFGAVASIGKKIVSVGTLDWVRRHGVVENPFVETEKFKNQSVVYVGIDGVLAGFIYVEKQKKNYPSQFKYFVSTIPESLASKQDFKT